MRPSSRSQSAATTALRKVHGELFRVKRLREIPHWWILGGAVYPLGIPSASMGTIYHNTTDPGH